MIQRGELVVGWLSAGFFGLGIPLALISLLPGSSYLQLTPNGIEVSSLYRKWFVKWTDVQEFAPIRIATREMVGWNYSPSYTGQRLGRMAARGIAGIEAALPDTYGQSADALATLLNQWRTRYAVAP